MLRIIVLYILNIIYINKNKTWMLYQTYSITNSVIAKLLLKPYQRPFSMIEGTGSFTADQTSEVIENI